MLKSFFLFFFIFHVLTIPVNAQATFQKGYYITQNGEKVYGLIKNMDWRSNPEEFEFKATETSVTKYLSLNEVNQFEIFDYGKFIKRTVRIDRSSLDYNKLSYDPNPEYQTETLFLKVLIEGTASLYVYQDGNIERFFIETEMLPLEQLIFRYYRVNLTMVTDESYKNQLRNNLICSVNGADYEELDYRGKEFRDLFIEYYQCINQPYKSYNYKTISDLFNLTLKPSMKVVYLNIDNIKTEEVSAQRRAKVNNELGFKFATEIEIVMPYRNGVWAVAFEPGLQYYYKEFSNSNGSNYDIKYQSLEFPIGLKRRFFINNKNEIYLNVFLVYDIPYKSSFLYSEDGKFFEYEYDIRTSPNIFAGAGYKFNNKISFDVKYSTIRSLVTAAATWVTDYEYLSFGIGYSIK